MNTERKKIHVYVERTKTQHTTHWDMDYLPMAEVEKYYARRKAKPAAKKRPVLKIPRLSNRMLRLIFFLTGVGLIILGLALGRIISG